MEAAKFKNIIWDYTRKINESVNNALSPVCEEYDLTILQARILMEVFRYGPNTIGGLADNIVVTRTNASVMCKKMEQMGFLNRVRDSEDERVVKVYLTDKGNEILSEIDKIMDKRISQIIDNNREETVEDIIKGIHKLNEMLNKLNQ